MYLQTETARLNLRAIQPSDAEFMLKLLNTEGWLQFIGDRNIRQLSEAGAYIQMILDNPRYFYTVFELKTNQQAAGIISFIERDGHIYPDIGFAILPELAGKGYAFEACRAYLDLIINSNSYENIIGITLPANQPSIALLSKLGLRYSQSRTENDTILSIYSLK